MSHSRTCSNQTFQVSVDVPTPAGSTTTSKAQMFEDTSVEIADIDSRLHALQDFLRMAKGS